MSSVLVLGGYGLFGGLIVQALVKSQVAVIIAGRSHAKAEALAMSIRQQYPAADIRTAVIDVDQPIAAALTALTPQVVVHTSGPFQQRDYQVAQACIAQGIHYIDIADARNFVTGMAGLHEQARQAGVAVISGASTVPGLSSAVIEYYRPQFRHILSLKYGIAPAQRSPRGVATTKAILSYVGKALPHPGSKRPRYGWQNLYRQTYPVLGKRWMGNCDIADLILFPSYYGIKNIQFSASIENPVLHLATWGLSYLVRWGISLNLPRYAQLMLNIAKFFDRFGSADGGMHMLIDGIDTEGKAKSIHWFIIARDQDGPQIPTIPAVLLARQLLNQPKSLLGARSCMGLVSLEDYLSALKCFAVQVWCNGQQLNL